MLFRSYVPFYCTAIKRKLFEELGYLDERFNPGYGEDADFCHRAMLARYEVVQVDTFLPDEKDPRMTITDFPIWHAGEQSFQDKAARQRYVDKGMNLMREKWGSK